MTADLEQPRNDFPYPMLFDFLFAVTRFHPLLTDASRERIGAHLRKHLIAKADSPEAKEILLESPPDLLLDLASAAILISPHLAAAVSEQLAPYLLFRLEAASDVAVARLLPIVVTRAMPLSRGRTRGPTQDANVRERWRRYQRHITHPLASPTSGVKPASGNQASVPVAPVEGSVVGRVNGRIVSHDPDVFVGVPHSLDPEHVAVPGPVVADGGPHGPYAIIGAAASISHHLDATDDNFYDRSYVTPPPTDAEGFHNADALVHAHVVVTELLRRMDVSGGAVFDAVPSVLIPPLCVSIADAIQWLPGLPGFDRVLITPAVANALGDLIIDRVHQMTVPGTLAVLSLLGDIAAVLPLSNTVLTKLPTALVGAIFNGTLPLRMDDIVAMLAAVAEMYRTADAVDPPTALVDTLVEYIRTNPSFEMTTQEAAHLISIMRLFGMDVCEFEHWMTFKAGQDNFDLYNMRLSRGAAQPFYKGSGFGGVALRSGMAGADSKVISDMRGQPWVEKFPDYINRRPKQRYGDKVTPDGKSSSSLLQRFFR